MTRGKEAVRVKCASKPNKTPLESDQTGSFFKLALRNQAAMICFALDAILPADKLAAGSRTRDQQASPMLSAFLLPQNASWLDKPGGTNRLQLLGI